MKKKEFVFSSFKDREQWLDLWHFHFISSEMETLSISLVHFNEILKVNCHRPTSKSMNHLYQIF